MSDVVRKITEKEIEDDRNKKIMMSFVVVLYFQASLVFFNRKPTYM